MSGDRGLIDIDIDAELRAILQKLEYLRDQIGAPNLLKNAMNATARKVRKQMIQDAKGLYAIKDKRILQKENQGGPKIAAASAASLAATIISRGPMQDIMTFMTKPNTATGAAAARVLASGGMKSLEIDGLTAFVSTFASGHTAIVQRRTAGRLPIKKLLSPSVPHMLGNEAVRAEAERLTFEILHAEIHKRIEQVNAAGA